jgi:hypothetical protein
VNPFRTRSRFRRTIGLGVAIAIASLASASHAGPISAGAGFDYYTGPGDQITKSAIAYAGIGLGPVASAALAAQRYDDNQFGKGSAVTAGFGIPFLPLTSMRLQGTRWIGDESYRAWRAKIGPQVNLPTGQSVGAYYSHYADNGDIHADGVVGEFDAPLFGPFRARATASYSSISNGLKSGQGSVGLSFKPMHALELSGEIGRARNGASATQPFPSRPLSSLPLIGGGGGGGSTTTTETKLETTMLLGVRVTLP